MPAKVAKHVSRKTVKAVAEVLKSPPVSWQKNPQWTNKLVAYLSKHPDFRRKLFSDSTTAAKQEGRMKLTAKDGKAQQYGVLAHAIFHDEPTQSVTFNTKPGKFATAVETRLRRLELSLLCYSTLYLNIFRLKADYQGYLGVVGKTGAGLPPDELRGHLADLQGLYVISFD
jgi:hypothetical protein